MKERYLEELKELLQQYNITEDEVADILADYGEMIEDAMSKNMSEEKILKMVGTPEEVVKSLSEEFVEGEEYIYIHRGGKSSATNRDNRITALMPFISVIVFMILGFGWGVWHPGWLVFLSIPMTAIVVNAFDKNSMDGFIALSPFVALIIFMVLGFGWGLWHPAWLIFLLVPILAIFSSVKTMRFISFLTAISPFVVVIAFILVWYFTGTWNPTWLVFMIIPMIGVLHERKLWKLIVFELGFLIAIGVYLYTGYVMHEWGYGLFAFLIPIGISLIFSEDSFLVINARNKNEWLVFLTTIIVYVGAGVIFHTTWAWLWLVFLFVPMYSILEHAPKQGRLIALMPFISTMIFFLLGFFVPGAWVYSWIAFLLIPMVAIIKRA
ncbi:MAG: DUF1700 domain-containing protein [Bacilli bacterium]|nr:DUF1700 domain-containing protein [Bacilli bacterium]MBN2877137.1 DUF1700 domain-containing protein [Bacilli bacterium]